MTRKRAFLKRLIGRVREMAGWWTALGAMLIPLAVVVLALDATIRFPSFWGIVAFCLIVLGVTSFILGWVKTLSEEQQRKREGKVTLFVLASIAEKLGVDMDDAVKKIEKLTEK